MSQTISISATNRKIGKHQVDEQRASILDAAETLFLKNGLENTSMVDIANQAGITRVTLYRYFANRDAIALEIHIRMLDRVSAAVGPEGNMDSLEGMRQHARSMIRNFATMRDAYRYIGMFDKIYLDQAPDSPLAQWTKDQLTTWNWGKDAPAKLLREHPSGNEIHVIFNTITWFLEKLALRGELTWGNKNVPLEEDLRIFEDMIMGYFDRLIETKDR